MGSDERLEWHDARVERVELLPEGEARVVVSRIYQYAAGEGGPSTRLREAELLLRGVTKVQLDGQLAYEGYLSFGQAVLPDGARVELSQLGLSGAVTAVTLAFTNGARIEVQCSAVAVQLGS